MLKYTVKNILLIILLHIIIAITGYLLLRELEIFKAYPNNRNLLNWDAAFHYSIATEGYEYIAFTGCNLAFFPLFPLIWKMTGLTPIWISVFNFVIFACSFGWLLKMTRISQHLLLLLISIPSFIFLGLPYSESTFFLFASLIIIGYKSDNTLMKNFGFFGASLAKSVSVVFIPAIVLCEYLIFDRQKSTEMPIKTIIRSSLASLAGLFTAAVIQGIQTGKWFYFLELQKYWGRHWIIPEIPLHTPVAYDAVGFILGIIAIYIGIKYFCTHIISLYASTCEPLKIDSPVLFSLLYLSATVVLDTFFTYNNGGANIWSLNRHFFCTPFAIVFLIWLVHDFKPSRIEQLLLACLLISGIFITGIYDNLLMIITYLAFMTSLVILSQRPIYAKYLIIIYLFNCFIQIQYYHDFLSGNWIG